MTASGHVKVCGVTTPCEITALAEHGVQWGGLCVGLTGEPYDLDVSRARELAAGMRGAVVPVLVTISRDAETIAAIVDEVAPGAVQLAGFVSPPRVGELRARYPRGEVQLVKVLHVRRGRLQEARLLEAYVDAGVDWFLLDSMGDGEQARLGSTGSPPTVEALEAFRDRDLGLPVLVAGGVDADNAAGLIAASGARGVDVLGSVRRDGRIAGDRVRALVDAVRGA